MLKNKKLGRIETLQTAKQLGKFVAYANAKENHPYTKDWHKTLLNNSKHMFPFSIEDRIKNPNIIDDVKKGKAFRIDDLLWQINPVYTLNNLPNYNVNQINNLHFSFGDTLEEAQNNQKEMITTPKTLINVLAYATRINPNKHFDAMLSFYAVAPELKNQLLPQIYRMDVLVSPNKKFFRITASAIVAGCAGGDCPLFQINCPSKTEGFDSCRLFTFQSGFTKFYPKSKQEFSNIYFEVDDLDEIKTFDDACAYMFKQFNLSTKYDNTKNIKVNEIVKDIKQNNSSISPIDSTVVNEFFDLSFDFNDKSNKLESNEDSTQDKNEGGDLPNPQDRIL